MARHFFWAIIKFKSQAFGGNKNCPENFIYQKFFVNVYSSDPRTLTKKVQQSGRISGFSRIFFETLTKIRQM